MCRHLNSRISLTDVFDNRLPTSVVFSATSVSYMDIQAGLNYAYFPQENIYINAGYSIHHVNKPRRLSLPISPTTEGSPCGILDLSMPY